MPFRSIAPAIVLAGCLSVSPTPPPGRDASPDAGSAPEIVSWVVRDVAGRVYEPAAVPRRPSITLESSVPLAWTGEEVALLSGGPDEDLLADLERAPFARATEARSLPVSLAARGTALEAVPDAPLAPGALYTLAVGAWAADPAGAELARPFTATVRIAEGPDAGAIVTDTWPADGTAGVPPQVSLLAVRFDADVSGIDDIRLLDADGAPVAVRRQSVLCDLVGWTGGRCVVLRPSGALAPSTVHFIEIGAGVHDATGASVGPARSQLRTAPGDTPEPSWAEPACALDESAVEVGCALADDRSVELRLSADAPVRLWLVGESATAAAVAPRGEATLRLDGLAAGTTEELLLRAVDLAGREQLVELEVTTPNDLAPVAITEVRSDPRGPEPAQEYVEVTNLSRETIDLAGFQLADRADREGDAIERSALVPPLGRALLVADGFDPDGPEDEPVPAGVPLIRLGASLGSGGITNGGEPLFLRDPLGRRVSAAPALAVPTEGTCLVRTVADPRRGDSDAFSLDPEHGCTPGEANRLP